MSNLRRVVFDVPTCRVVSVQDVGDTTEMPLPATRESGWKFAEVAWVDREFAAGTWYYCYRDGDRFFVDTTAPDPITGMHVEHAERRFCDVFLYPHRSEVVPFDRVVSTVTLRGVYSDRL